MEILWFILAAYGMTQILVYGNIFNHIRPKKEDYSGWGELFHCTMCMGFWVGVIVCLISPWTELFTFDYTVANFLICGCVGSGTSYMLSMLIQDEGVRYVAVQNRET